MVPQAHACECCGAPAKVHVMHEIGSPGSAHHFCMRCAEGCDDNLTQSDSLNHSAVLVVIGFFLLTTSILADWLQLGHRHGFGAWQVASMMLAVVVISSGALVRISSLSVLGLCLLLVTLAADYLGLDGRTGFGVRQTTVLVIACITIATGVALGCLPPRATQSASFRAAKFVESAGRRERPKEGDHRR